MVMSCQYLLENFPSQFPIYRKVVSAFLVTMVSYLNARCTVVNVFIIDTIFPFSLPQSEIAVQRSLLVLPNDSIASQLCT